MWGCEDVKMWREGEKIRCEDEKIRCEDEKMWGWEDLKMRKCEDVQMWRWEDVRMSRWENVKMWGCEGGEDVKMWGWEDANQRVSNVPAFIRVLVQSHALLTCCVKERAESLFLHEREIKAHPRSTFNENQLIAHFRNWPGLPRAYSVFNAVDELHRSITCCQKSSDQEP